jgi:hypothetical protein
VCVHRDCVMLVEGEQADAGGHLGAHTYSTKAAGVVRLGGCPCNERMWQWVLRQAQQET